LFPLKDTIRSRSFPLVNWVLIAVNLLVFIFESSLDQTEVSQLFLSYGLIPARFEATDPASILTLFTSMVLHGGWLHLISNLWALYIFGDNVEDRMGSARYLIFYLLCGVVAGFAQVFITANQSVPGIGASGAIAGVLAAYLVLFPRARVITLVFLFFFITFIEIPAVLYLGFWFFSQIFSGVMALGAPDSVGGIAYWAHIGGFLGGLSLVLLFARRPRAQYRWHPDEFKPW
jgi:membrane associated rhomboid family serine protease